MVPGMNFVRRNRGPVRLVSETMECTRSGSASLPSMNRTPSSVEQFELAFDLCAVAFAGESADGQAGGDDAMAGDFWCKGIPSQGLPDGLARSAPDGLSYEAIGADLATRDAAGGVIDFLLKGGGSLTMDRGGMNCAKVAEPTGLEPATSAVTGRRSNQLSYSSGSTSGRRSERKMRIASFAWGATDFQPSTPTLIPSKSIGVPA